MIHRHVTDTGQEQFK